MEGSFAGISGITGAASSEKNENKVFVPSRSCYVNLPSGDMHAEDNCDCCSKASAHMLGLLEHSHGPEEVRASMFEIRAPPFGKASCEISRQPLTRARGP